MDCDQNRLLSCYEEGFRQQESDLDELLQAMSAGQGGARPDDDLLRKLVAKCLRSYEEYVTKRREMLRSDSPSFCCPAWCNSLEKSLLWIGGCRPSMFIRMVYTLSTSELEAHLDELLGGAGGGSQIVGVGSGGASMVGLSARQLELVNNLHRRTIRVEDTLSSRMATVQEDVANKPLLSIVKDLYRGGGGGGGGEDSGVTCDHDGESSEVGAAIGSYTESLSKVMEEADRLRLGTARELAMEILTPLQAVELLTTGKQLHLSIHEWGRLRDLQHGRT